MKTFFFLFSMLFGLFHAVHLRHHECAIKSFTLSELVALADGDDDELPPPDWPPPGQPVPEPDSIPPDIPPVLLFDNND